MVNECLSLEICQDCSQHPSCKGCKMGKRWTRMTNFPSLVDIIHLEHCICLAGFDQFQIIPTYGNGIIDFHQFDAELGPHQWHLLPTLKLNRWGVLAHEHQLMTRKHCQSGIFAPENEQRHLMPWFMRKIGQWSLFYNVLHIWKSTFA